MPEASVLPTAQDPRKRYWVSFGLWPDCPECQGLLSPDYQWRNPPEGSFLGHNELVVHCSQCPTRTARAGSKILERSHKDGSTAPYGTWPDCTECQGYGGRYFNCGIDPSDRDFAPCTTCRDRTAEYHRQHPTELDRLLRAQQMERQPLLDQHQSLRRQLDSIESNIQNLTEQHQTALEPHIKHIRQLMARNLITAP